MIIANPLVMLSILHRDYPDVAASIHEQISKSMPAERLTDFELLPAMVNQFLISAKTFDQPGILPNDQVDWRTSRSYIMCVMSSNIAKRCSITELREILLAVVLMLFHPEKILSLTSRPAKSGLIKQLSILLKCDKVTLSQSMSNAISHYKTYKSFRDDVEHLYNDIKIQAKYFE